MCLSLLNSLKITANRILNNRKMTILTCFLIVVLELIKRKINLYLIIRQKLPDLTLKKKIQMEITISHVRCLQ